MLPEWNGSEWWIGDGPAIQIQAPSSAERGHSNIETQ